MDRMVRVNELIKRELGRIVEYLICPELDALLTVTDVNTSPDLHHANVKVSVYGDAVQKSKAIQLLSEHRVGIQNEMSSHIRLKYTPVLHFHLDESLDKADRIFKILKDLGLDDEENGPG